MEQGFPTGRKETNSIVLAGRQTPALDRLTPFLRRHNVPVSAELPIMVHVVGTFGYAGILLAMWVTFSSHGDALFMVAVSTFLAMVFFGVPYLMYRTARRNDAQRGLHGMSDFLAGDFETSTGRLTGWEAFVQVVTVPLSLAFGATAIGIIISVLRS